MMDESTNQKPYLSNHHYTLELNLAAIWLKVKNNNVIMEYDYSTNYIALSQVQYTPWLNADFKKFNEPG